MNDDYKKGYADAMGWKTENHLEHLQVVQLIQRNDVLEEVAKEFEKMKAFEKDTMASFAAYVRGMKR
jgi:hypothetical protein